MRTGTNAAAFGELLAAASIDAVLSVTPYHDQDGLVLWAAQRRGIPSLTSVISFDNPTTAGTDAGASASASQCGTATTPSELVRSYPDLDADRVEIVGAPQFDLHRRPELDHGPGRVVSGARSADGSSHHPVRRRAGPPGAR